MMSSSQRWGWFGSRSATSSTPLPLSAASPARLDTTFLDGLRGLAALYVLIHHADYLLRRGYLTQVQSFGRLIPAEDHATFYKYLTYTLSVFRWGNGAVV